MPKVGKKSFPYTPAGKKAAHEYAEKTGKSVKKTSKPDKNHPWRRGY
jgi:hypothetical protein